MLLSAGDAMHVVGALARIADAANHRFGARISPWIVLPTRSMDHVIAHLDRISRDSKTVFGEVGARRTPRRINRRERGQGRGLRSRL
jgi:hypothetical protein